MSKRKLKRQKVTQQILFLITIVEISLLAFLLIPRYLTPDENTKKLCLEYASRDHEKEFSPERWSKDKSWIKSFDWYGSCLNHIKYPVAKNK